MKYVLIFIIGFLLCLLIGVGLSILFYRFTKKKHKRITIILAIFLPIIFMFSILTTYVSIYNRADKACKDYLVSSNKVIVEKKNSYYSFKSDKSSNKAIIFYPGAKVEYISYAPLMYNLASEGIDCYLVHMPFNIAFLGRNKASSIISETNYDRYYMMGHSLGGSVASLYAKDNDKINGLILLASYSTKTIDKKALSIYGSNDGVLNIKDYEKKKNNLKSLKEVIIDGGNHSQFGMYGLQKKDHKATISYETQQENTINAIKLFILGE